MLKSINELLEETERLIKANAALQQKLQQAGVSTDGIISGSVDALVIADHKTIKVLTEATADKIYRILIEKMNEGAVTLNEEGTILFCNSCFANMVNLPLQKVTGTKFENFLHEASKELLKNLTKQAGQNSLKKEIYIKTNDGRAIPVLISLNTLKMDSDVVISIILTDLTIQNKSKEELNWQTKRLEQQNIELEDAVKELQLQSEEKEKRAAELIIVNKKLVIESKEKHKREAELKTANKKLRHQNEEKEKRATELAIANKELEAFTYISSHDLQEPLRKIQIFSALILEKEDAALSQQGKDYFQRIQKAAKRMQILIKDLLLYSYISIQQSLEYTSLNEILEGVIADHKETIREKNAFIEADSLCTACIDSSQFRQVMHNLMGNSLKFADPRRPLHIVIKSEIVEGNLFLNEQLLLSANKLSPGKSYCHLSFSDNGIGFDQQFKNKIFDLFQRLHAKEKYPGTGIGLAIVKKIIERHNGVIIASGEPNRGARFDIYIPA